MKSKSKSEKYLLTKPIHSASISASVSRSVNEDKFWEQYQTDVQLITQAKNLREFLKVAKNILPFWLKSRSRYYGYIILAMRRLAERHRKGRPSIPPMPADSLSIELWITDVNRALKVKTPKEKTEYSKPLNMTKWSHVLGVSRNKMRELRDQKKHYHFREVSPRLWSLPIHELPAEYLQKYRQFTS